MPSTLKIKVGSAWDLKCKFLVPSTPKIKPESTWYVSSVDI